MKSGTKLRNEIVIEPEEELAEERCNSTRCNEEYSDRKAKKWDI